MNDAADRLATVFASAVFYSAAAAAAAAAAPPPPPPAATAAAAAAASHPYVSRVSSESISGDSASVCLGAKLLGPSAVYRHPTIKLCMQQQLQQQLQQQQMLQGKRS
ncbi:hypothetical protein EPH_0072210 [Eimeria praecox]|uniref:Uncharacterized protein n=1 Tax=Eimeria praecox TaxID=51316 RepID=U6H9A9_9EIME|nr:hypothetical protein EPH_0072210 [Eimeria praecox]